MYRKLSILFLIFISSCSNPEEMKTKTAFFDIKGFFESEVKRLTNRKSTVNKSVRQNEQSEIKKNLSVDWANELALFIASDINKPAWKDSYKISGDSVHLSYVAIDTNLRTRSVEIKIDQQGRTVFFKIKNITRSKLYESSEELTYIPDSIYTINKNQIVRFLGKNTYQISGTVLK
jgi:hypothetical protein